MLERQISAGNHFGEHEMFLGSSEPTKSLLEIQLN